MAGPGAASGITLVASQSFSGSLKVAQLAGALEDERNNHQDALIALNKSSIKSISDLRGKKLGIFPGIQWRVFARRIAKKNGLDPDKDLTLVEIPIQQHVSALLSSNVDATLAVEPTGAIAEATGQAKQIIKSITTKYLCNPFYMGATVLSAEFIKKRSSGEKPNRST
jgi:NitT/TauT family transport system substrate-binding protein